MEATKTAPKKVLNGWAMYDWANSVYSLVITTTFFPVYYTTITQPIKDAVPFAGRFYVNTALYNYALAFTYLIVALCLPILSSIADYRGNKRGFMRFFVIIGSIACSAMFFFNASNVWLGIICLMIAAFGFHSSLVFYNSYLPEIAAVEDRDRVSAKGFSYGYVGSVLMQIVGFVLVMFWDKIPFFKNEGDAVRTTFLLVGLWWFGFAQFALSRLHKGAPNPRVGQYNIFTGGFNELRKVYNLIIQQPVLKRFLAAFFFYNMGVQTVMLAATNFGSKELGLPSTNLIITVVIIQLVAIIGANLMSYLSRLFGNFRVLIGVVIFWIFVCMFGYVMQTALHFYILAVCVGLVMGGIQSLSRSTYSKLMPPTRDTASFFSFYDVTEKVAIVIGLFAFGMIEEITGSMRNSVLALITFFALGLLLLIWASHAAKKNKILTHETLHD